MQGPTVSPVFRKRDGKVASDYFAIVICVPKKALYKSVQQLRAVSLFIIFFFYKSILLSMLNYRLFQKFMLLGNSEFNHLTIILTIYM